VVYANAWARDDSIMKRLAIIICLTSLLGAGSAAAADGEWVRRGKPLRQFPSCYQMWVCTAADKPAGQFKGMPRGTWGTCDTAYVAGGAQNTAENCERCLAPPPDEPCRP